MARSGDETAPKASQRAREARKPRSAALRRDLSFADLMAITGRLVASIGEENLTLIAAGVSFYAMLALAPMMIALVSIYGFIADPADMRELVALLAPLVPKSAYALIETQVATLAQKSDTTFQFTSVGGAFLAVWSAKAGVNALLTGLNIANREREGRGMLVAMLFSYALTLGLILIMTITLAAIVVAPAALAVLPGEGWTAWLARWLRWPIALAAVIFSIGFLYRLGPSRRGARLPWLSPGALLATAVWMLASIGFSYYIATFGSYQAAYGALGAVIILMLWLWLSALIVLVGARLNAEMEFQTASDTTVGPPRPMGERGAFVADHLPSEQQDRRGRASAKPADEA